MHQFFPNIKKYISPPNPIFDKTTEDPLPQNQKPAQGPVDLNSDQQTDLASDIYTLFNAYSQKDLVFMKWSKRQMQRNGIKYFASHFLEPQDKQRLAYQGQVGQNALVFDSSMQSGNLLAAFKTADEQYDLIMQNDVNSSGYTQWFNFTASNGKRKGTVKFNIVNFYKKQSLFRQGMKPLTRSLLFDKNWKRGSYKVEYYINELRMEGRKKKYYKTLSFNYDFIFENDTVQICSAYPYTYDTFFSWMQNLNSPKLRVKYLGATSLKKVITMFHISSGYADERNPKRAIAIMGRQHAGETPSSFVIEAMVEQLLGFSQQIELLLQKFQFYIFPMVNVDGVVLGNYRCNLGGFDLNRCWDQQLNKNVTEIVFIKNELKKIMKKSAIQIILDIHGHSSKMNSFFYGNTFGRHNFIFPYFASKIEPMIDLSSCSFTDDDKEKSKTARVILGNMIRETGSAYTYEVSLFGHTKGGKNVPFLLENFKEMGRSLLTALSKCQVEICKEEKNLKESLFLKELRKEIKKVQSKLMKNQAESDNQAKKTTLIEEGAKIIVPYQKKKSHVGSKGRQLKIGKELLQKQTQTQHLFDANQYQMTVSINPKITNPKKLSQKISQTTQKRRVSFSTGKITSQSQTYKDFLINKLKVFGQTFSIEKIGFTNRNLDVISVVQDQAQTAYTMKILKDRLHAQSGPIDLDSNLSLAFYNTMTRKAQLKDKFSIRPNKSRTGRMGEGKDISFEGLCKVNKIQ